MSHPLDEIKPDPASKPKARYSREDYEAIGRARARGLTWKQIGMSFGLKPGSAAAFGDTYDKMHKRFNGNA